LTCRPGTTGYNPSGSTPYQSPATPYAPPAGSYSPTGNDSTDAAPYRPGSTGGVSDYVPRKTATGSATSTASPSAAPGVLPTGYTPRAGM
jgi:hypothetical protein